MGNAIQDLAAGVTLCATTDTWIEGEAIRQLKQTATLPGMRHVAGMPDLHPGRGYPVGAAFFCGRIYLSRLDWRRYRLRHGAVADRS